VINLKGDLALRRDPSTRLMPWITAVMTFLGALALAGALITADLIRDWRDQASGRWTVQIAAAAGTDLRQRTDRATRLLRAIPGVARARALDSAEVQALLAPWFGAGIDLDQLPVPGLIDVQIEPGAAVDAGTVRAELGPRIPGLSIDDHGRWLDRLVTLARTTLWLALGIVAVVLGALVAVVVFATRAGLTAHHDAIELMHLVGARDRHIAAEFQRHALVQALFGAAGGALAAGLAVVLLGHISSGLDAALMPRFGFGPGAWLGLALVPMAVAALAAVTARWTVLRRLKDMP